MGGGGGGVGMSVAKLLISFKRIHVSLCTNAVLSPKSLDLGVVVVGSSKIVLLKRDVF